MTDFVAYEPGTIQVTNGGKNFVGTGTDFSVYSPGDWLIVDGYPCSIDTITDDTHGAFKFNHLGTSGSGKTYRWIPLSDLSRALTLDQRVLALITDPSSLFNAYTAASSTGPAKLDLFEDTDLGSNRVRITPPAAGLTGDRTFTLPDMDITALGGDLGTTDNRLLRADGTAKYKAQASPVTVDDSGNMSGVGTLAAGATTLSAILTLNGGQIAMPASEITSAGANVWTDYEKGTSAVAPFSQNGSLAAATSSLRYIKSGSGLLVHGDSIITNANTGSGYWNQPLPFTPTGSTATGVAETNATGIGGIGYRISGSNLSFSKVDASTFIAAPRTITFGVGFSV